MSELIRQGFSIVLCTYNGEQKLQPTLDHIAGLTIPEGHELELILVDNASTDKTQCFTKEFWSSLGHPFPLRILYEPRPGKGYAIEMGYDAAQYSYVLTVDDDNWLDTAYLVNAVELLSAHQDVGILQGKSIGVFESELPTWAEDLEPFFVIGSPIKDVGYFPDNFYKVWGAGMIIKNEDWMMLRALGFSFLTSKNLGKAAGEDHETAIALLMLGRKIYYSNKLVYRHFMPSSRITWANLKNGFNVWGYLIYYYFLYALVLDSYEKKYIVTSGIFVKKILTRAIFFMAKYTWKQHLAYWVMPNKEFYQLGIYREYCHYKLVLKLSNKFKRDIEHLQSWMVPILDKNPHVFKMPFKSLY